MSHLLARFTHPFLRTAILAAVTGAGLGPVVLRAAEPAQVPLTSRVAVPPPPNFMITIDDSGSMLADFMPEDDFTLNGFNVNLSIGVRGGSGYIGGYPNDVRKSGARLYDGVVVGLAGDTTNAYQRQYRSPDVNRIYYNPDIRYSPWVAPSGGLLPNSPPTQAALDPTSPGETRNLTKRWKNISATWCTAANSCAWGTRNFDPGLYYRLKDKADPTKAASYIAYNINDSVNYGPASKPADRSDCVLDENRCTQDEERQNFANWFTYYRMRETLTKAAISKSLSQYVDKLRVGWAHINQSQEYSVDDGKKVSRIETEENGGPMRPFDATRMTTVLGGIQAIRSSGGTPLRIAMEAIGKYFSRTTDEQVGSPWLEDPHTSTSKKLACRRSVNLLMTDGYYNDSYASAGDADGSNGDDYSGDIKNPNKYPAPNQYIPSALYMDESPVSNTLADVAMKYFKNDLDTTIQNKVLPRTGDIAYWQHLTQFTVGLGVRGTLDSTPDAKKDTLDKIAGGDLFWPKPDGSNAPTLIDDMWHAAVNTGGDFYSVANVEELTKAFSDAIDRAVRVEAKEAGVATASASVTADNVKYVPKYQSGAWFGDVEALQLGTDGLEGTLIWSASQHLPVHTARSLFTWDASKGARGEPVEFKWDAMGSNNQTRVGSDALTQYIRGDRSNESDDKPYRFRDGKYLGDFINSPPVVVRGKLDLGYSVFDPTYSDFVARKKARSEAAIVVGGNAGAVHVFRGVDGTEVFGYLPQEGLTNLKDIAAKDYGTKSNFHRFFVDGPMNETDAKIPTRRNSSEEWANLVIGSMGAGGKAFFAMHIPTDFGAGLDAEDLGANTLLWEKSGASDGDIGYMFADFAVGKLKGGGWKAFVGNGVYSTNGNAVLLVVDMATGVIEKHMTVSATGDTGLMGVSLIKDVATQEVVGAYAGDLKGNVWRFDFEGADSANWKIGFKGKPLFTATDPDGGTQPITVPPVFVDHPKQGRVVLFGSGKLIDEADSESTQRQTYYGVWDNVKIGDSSAELDSPFEPVAVDRSRLAILTIDKDNPVSDTAGTYYKVTGPEVNWDTDLGWQVDLPWDRQRVIYPSIILSNAYVYFSTMVPAAPAGQCDPTAGVGYNFLLTATSGQEVTVPVFDTNGDGVIDDQDEVVGGFETRSDGRDAIVVGVKDCQGETCEVERDCKGNIVGYWLCSTEQDCRKINLPPATCTGTVIDRVWKQILNPPTE